MIKQVWNVIKNNNTWHALTEDVVPRIHTREQSHEMLIDIIQLTSVFFFLISPEDPSVFLLRMLVHISAQFLSFPYERRGDTSPLALEYTPHAFFFFLLNLLTAQRGL